MPLIRGSGKLFKQSHGLLIVHLEQPLILRHNGDNGTVLTMISASCFDDLNFTFQPSFFHFMFHVLVQVFTTAFFTLVSTTHIQNAVGDMRFFMHVPKVINRTIPGKEQPLASGFWPDILAPFKKRSR